MLLLSTALILNVNEPAFAGVPDMVVVEPVAVSSKSKPSGKSPSDTDQSKVDPVNPVVAVTFPLYATP